MKVDYEIRPPVRRSLFWKLRKTYGEEEIQKLYGEQESITSKMTGSP